MLIDPTAPDPTPTAAPPVGSLVDLPPAPPSPIALRRDQLVAGGVAVLLLLAVVAFVTGRATAPDATTAVAATPGPTVAPTSVTTAVTSTEIVTYDQPAGSRLAPDLWARPATGAPISVEAARRVLTALWPARQSARQDRDESRVRQLSTGDLLEADVALCRSSCPPPPASPLGPFHVGVSPTLGYPAAFAAEVDTVDGAGTPTKSFVIVVRESIGDNWKMALESRRPASAPSLLPSDLVADVSAGAPPALEAYAEATRALVAGQPTAPGAPVLDSGDAAALRPFAAAVASAPSRGANAVVAIVVVSPVASLVPTAAGAARCGTFAIGESVTSKGGMWTQRADGPVWDGTTAARYNHATAVLVFQGCLTTANGTTIFSGLRTAKLIESDPIYKL